MIDLRPQLLTFIQQRDYAQLQLGRAASAVSGTAYGGSLMARRSDLQMLRDFCDFALHNQPDEFIPDEQVGDPYAPLNQHQL